MCPFLGRGKNRGGVEEFAMACMMRHGHGEAWEVPEGREKRLAMHSCKREVALEAVWMGELLQRQAGRCVLVQ